MTHPKKNQISALDAFALVVDTNMSRTDYNKLKRMLDALGLFVFPCWNTMIKGAKAILMPPSKVKEVAEHTSTTMCMPTAVVATNRLDGILEDESVQDRLKSISNQVEEGSTVTASLMFKMEQREDFRLLAVRQVVVSPCLQRERCPLVDVDRLSTDDPDTESSSLP